MAQATLDEDIATPPRNLRDLPAALTLARGHDLSKVQGRRGQLQSASTIHRTLGPNLKDRPAARLQPRRKVALT